MGSLPNLDSQLDIAPIYPGINFMADSSADPRHNEILGSLVGAHRKRSYKAVFIDALRGVHQHDDKDSEIPPLVYRRLATLFPGATIVLVHHERKTKPEATHEPESETFSGSQAWINHATVGIRVTKQAKHGEILTLHHVKSQASELAHDLRLRIIDGWSVRAAIDASKKEVDEALSMIDGHSPGLKLREKDKMLAEHFHVSERTARGWRIRAGQTGAEPVAHGGSHEE